LSPYLQLAQISYQMRSLSQDAVDCGANNIVSCVYIYSSLDLELRIDAKMIPRWCSLMVYLANTNQMSFVVLVNWHTHYVVNNELICSKLCTLCTMFLCFCVWFFAAFVFFWFSIIATSFLVNKCEHICRLTTDRNFENAQPSGARRQIPFVQVSRRVVQYHTRASLVWKLSTVGGVELAWPAEHDSGLRRDQVGYSPGKRGRVRRMVTTDWKAPIYHRTSDGHSDRLTSWKVAL